MARTELGVITSSREGTPLGEGDAGDVANGNVMHNDGKTLLLVVNTDAEASHTITFALFRTVDGQSAEPRTETVLLGESRLFGPFSAVDYGASLSVNVDDALVTITALRAG